MRARWPNRSTASTATGGKWKVLTSSPVTSSSGPGSWMSRLSQKNSWPAAACLIASGVASEVTPFWVRVPFILGWSHGRGKEISWNYPACRAPGHSASGGDEAGLVGEHHRLDAVTEAELGQDPADVHLDRSLGQVEVGGDLAVGPAGGR